MESVGIHNLVVHICTYIVESVLVQQDMNE